MGADETRVGPVDPGIRTDVDRYQQMLEAARHELEKLQALAEEQRSANRELEEQAKAARSLGEQLEGIEKRLADLRRSNEAMEEEIRERRTEIARLKARKVEERQKTKTKRLPGWFFKACLPWIAAGLALAAPARAGTNLVVLLDRSGSMIKTDPSGLAAPAAIYLLDELAFRDPDGRASVVLFDSRVRTIPENGRLTGDLTGLIEKVRGIPPPSPTGNTEMAPALEACNRLFKGLEGDKQAILLTDGRPESGDPDRYGGRYREVIRKVLEKKAPPEKMYRALQEYILEQVLPVLRRNDIRVLPVGFGGVDDAFLRRLGGGGGHRTVKTIAEVIPAADELIEKGPGVFSVRRRLGEKGATFEVPPAVGRMRVVVLFPSPGPAADNTRVVLENPAGQPVNVAGKRALLVRGKAGRVFERLVLDTPAPGRWQVRLVRVEKTLPLPQAEVLVEMRSSLTFKVSASPPDVCAGDEVSVGARLENRSGGAVPLAEVDGAILDAEGTWSRLLVFEADADGGYWSRLRLPPDLTPGVKTVRVSGRLPQGAVVKTSAEFTTQPAAACRCPIQLVPEIPLGSEDASLRDDALVFPPIGASEQRTFTIRGVRVRVPAGTVPPRCQKRFPVRLVVSPLESAEGDVLPASSGWIEVVPGKGKVSAGEAFQFDVTASLPEHITSDVRDGLYKGEIQVLSPNLDEPFVLPVEITVRVPEIRVLSPAVVDGDVARQETALCCPGPTGRVLTVRLESTAPGPVDLSVGMSGAFYREGPGGSSMLSSQELRLVPLFDVDEPVRVEPARAVGLRFRVEQPGGGAPPPGRYRSRLVLHGTTVRSQPLEVQVAVPERYPWTRAIRYGGAGAAAVLAGVGMLGLFRVRRGLEGGRVRFVGDELFSSIPNRDAFSGSSFSVALDPGSGQWELTATRTITHRSMVDGETRLPPGAGVWLNTGDQVDVGRGTTLVVAVTPGMDRDELRITVARTRLSRLRAGLWAGCLVLALALAVGALGFAPWVCNQLVRWF